MHRGASPFVALIVMLAACGSPGGRETAPAIARVARGEPVRFSYVAVDGVPFTSASVRGRATVLLFITTYDVPSQLLARQVNALLHRYRPRINAGAIVLEPPRNRLLVDAFASSLGLDYPVAMSDMATLGNGGPFGEIPGVPTVVVLDRRGREVWRGEGTADIHSIEAALAKAVGRQDAPASSSRPTSRKGEGR